MADKRKTKKANPPAKETPEDVRKRLMAMAENRRKVRGG